MLVLAIALLRKSLQGLEKFQLLVQGDPKIGLLAAEIDICVAAALTLLYLSAQKHDVNCLDDH